MVNCCGCLFSPWTCVHCSFSRFGYILPAAPRFFQRFNALGDAQDCLDWEIQTHPSGDELSSCAYYNRDRASTRFLVSNHCQTSVRGIFSYYSDDRHRQRVKSVQPFAVDPGATTEVANPCNMTSDWSYYVTRADGEPLAQR